MATIHIENIGAIQDTGVIELKPIMLFLGRQGAGKSTLMKILCYCRWIEKMVMRENKNLEWYTHYGRFIKGLMSFHRLHEDFFNTDSRISYQGETVTIQWEGGKKIKGNAKIQRTKEFAKLRHNLKISFLPAERNLASALSNIDKNYKSNTRDCLFNFVMELIEAQANHHSRNPLSLSISKDLFFYSEGGNDFIVDKKSKKTLPVFYAASGIQSAFPIDLLSAYLFEKIGQTPDMSFTEFSLMLSALEDKKNLNTLTNKVKQLQKQLFYSSALLFIEEPEQNLFPESQKLLMQSLLRWLSNCRQREVDNFGSSSRSSVVFTTHSPYLLSVINVQMAASRARSEINSDKELSDNQKLERLDKLAAFLEEKNMNFNLAPEDYAAYFITNQGSLVNLIAKDFAMISGVELDGVSYWVDEVTDRIYQIAYGS